MRLSSMGFTFTTPHLTFTLALVLCKLVILVITLNFLVQRTKCHQFNPIACPFGSWFCWGAHGECAGSCITTVSSFLMGHLSLHVQLVLEVLDLLQSISLVDWQLVLEIPRALFHLHFRLGRGSTGNRKIPPPPTPPHPTPPQNFYICVIVVF